MAHLAITSGSYTSFAHRILWDSMNRHLTISNEHVGDSWMLHLSAGLLGAAAFEAYLNYLGGEILPDVWANERQFFSSDAYKGTRGKLKKRIAEELGYRPPPAAHKPFTGWLELVSLRDKLVHARPKKVTYRTAHPANGFPKLPSSWLYQEASAEKVRSLIAHTETLATELHTLVLRSEFQDVIFGSHPFEGAMGFGTRSVETAGQHVVRQRSSARFSRGIQHERASGK